MSSKPLILASQSPRRAELLRQIGVEFRVQTADIDESPMAKELPLVYLRRMAESKARAVQSTLNPDQQNSSPVILAADTIGDLDGEVLIKPRDRDDALAMLQRMSARGHTVATGVCVLSGDKCDYIEVKTQVRFRALSEQEILRYWDSGEPRDKAGAYGIQGLGAVFVESIEGSYSNVVGLPLCETASLLQNAGVAFWQPLNAD
ncbi:Maf family protein [Pseudoteredinibacter isoporae]|uniref:dTTP/UTP pyrophosphatase n=1 Tax=Pseudoteredinibacter isoporae TaxID=570281 RepID=A0A7X0MXX0_9GAMM|nr:Maf family protein [Pseudoteredinibacter isoporae]MBB6521402.1 septum formation protein [Pseudoteredinibacter isoporae]NHO86957.1 septum formation inhibitor Maf [Pseudoteredinibacter isoporae]NIB24590.1 septum formation inhibitor Maf [Pseudoteredinibacter isoporae]